MPALSTVVKAVPLHDSGLPVALLTGIERANVLPFPLSRERQFHAFDTLVLFCKKVKL